MSTVDHGRREMRHARVVAGLVAAGAMIALGLAHPDLAAAAGEPFSGGANNLKALWSDWSTPLFAILAGAIALHHYGSRDYGKLVVFLLAGALVGWIFGSPLAHLSSLGTHIANLLSV
jgi:hypothetical protein